MTKDALRFGRFKLIERLGVGGMAELFRAELSGPYGFSKTVAIKKILPELNRLPRFRKMFLRESRIMAALHHSNLVQVYELGEVEGELFMCLEYVEGCDLAMLLRSRRLADKLLPAWLAVWIVREVGRGLAFLHGLQDERGEDLSIVHRDVNPHNILLSVHGDVKLGDFGIAKGLSDEMQTRQGQIKGKLEYLSPEQTRGDVLGPASDLYALGLVLFELLTGQRYLQGQSDFELMRAAAQPVWRSAREVNPEVSSAQEEILKRMLRSDPQARFASAEALVAALDELWIGQAKSDPANSLAQQIKNLDQPPSETQKQAPDDELKSGDPLSWVEAEAELGRGADRRTGTLAMESLPPSRPRTLAWSLALLLLGLAGGAWWVLSLLAPGPGADKNPDKIAPGPESRSADLPPEPPHVDPTPEPKRAEATRPGSELQPVPSDDAMEVVKLLLAEEDEQWPAEPKAAGPSSAKMPRRQRRKARVRKTPAQVASKQATWSQDQRGLWLKRWQGLVNETRKRGVRAGDCRTCDAHARAWAKAFKAQDEKAAQAAYQGYSRALRELRIDGAFMDGKLRRLRTALERRGAAQIHEKQVNRILKEVVDGRLEQANRAINQLLDRIHS